MESIRGTATVATAGTPVPLWQPEHGVNYDISPVVAWCTVIADSGNTSVVVGDMNEEVAASASDRKGLWALNPGRSYVIKPDPGMNSIDMSEWWIDAITNGDKARFVAQPLPASDIERI